MLVNVNKFSLRLVNVNNFERKISFSYGLSVKVQNLVEKFKSWAKNTQNIQR